MVDVWKIGLGVALGAWLALLTIGLAFGPDPVSGAATFTAKLISRDGAGSEAQTSKQMKADLR